MRYSALRTIRSPHIVADPRHRVLTVPAGLHMYADPLHNPGVPSQYWEAPRSYQANLDQVKTENNEDELLFFRVAEGIFVCWFTLEYLVRYLVAPHKAETFTVQTSSQTYNFRSSSLFLSWILSIFSVFYRSTSPSCWRCSTPDIALNTLLKLLRSLGSSEYWGFSNCRVTSQDSKPWGPHWGTVTGWILWGF